jgi:hypothetical protein
VVLEALVPNLAGLFEAGHAFADFDVNPTVVGESLKGILVDDFNGEEQ